MLQNISAGLSAIRAANVGLAVTSNNIANQATPGFVRSTVDLATRPPINMQGFSIGTGVEVAGIRRVHDEALDAATVARYQFHGRDVAWLLDDRAANRGDHPFLVWEPKDGASRTWTYGEFAEATRKVAAGLSGRGVGVGDAVLIHAGNCPEAVIAWYAVARLGGISVTTNTRSVAAELSYFIEHSGDRAATLRLLNVHPAAWLDALPTDSCVVQERDLRSAEAPEAAGPVRLLDAGELQLRSAAGDIAFDSHYFPDVYPDVGGIAYDTALARVRHVADGTVTVAADGSDELGEVSISATMPAAMGLERVGGEAVVDGHVAAHASPAGDLDVAWSASRADASQDVVLVSYVRRGFDRVASIYCAVSDDGAFAVPAAAMALLPDLGGEHTDRLAVERVRSVSFTAPGMPDGLMLLIAGDAAYVE